MPTGIFVALIKIRVCILIIKCYRTCYANIHVRRYGLRSLQHYFYFYSHPCIERDSPSKINFTRFTQRTTCETEYWFGKFIICAALRLTSAKLCSLRWSSSVLPPLVQASKLLLKLEFEVLSIEWITRVLGTNTKNLSNTRKTEKRQVIHSA